VAEVGQASGVLQKKHYENKNHQKKEHFNAIAQGSPKHGPRTKSGPRSLFIRPQRHFVNNEKLTSLQKTC